MIRIKHACIFYVYRTAVQCPCCKYTNKARVNLIRHFRLHANSSQARSAQLSGGGKKQRTMSSTSRDLNLTPLQTGSTECNRNEPAVTSLGLGSGSRSRGGKRPWTESDVSNDSNMTPPQHGSAAGYRKRKRPWIESDVSNDPKMTPPRPGSATHSDGESPARGAG